MSEMFVNNQGVQTQTGTIKSFTDDSVLVATNHIGEALNSQSELDGANRLTALQVSNYAEQAVNAACGTVYDMCAFLTHSAETMGIVDHRESTRYNNETGGR